MTRTRPTTTLRGTTTTTKGTTTTGAEAEAATTSPAGSTAPGRRGRPAAGGVVGELFAAHGRMVLGLCRLLLRDPLEAEDAAQQVFLSAHRALLRGSVPRDPPAWLGTIARNECRARIRARMREPLALPELPADLPDPLAAAIRTADLDAVWLALSQLPRRQRRALMLRELGGLSYHELGRSLGVSQSAVESLLFRARRHVRSLIAGANAAAVPLALRDELGRLIPDFDPGSVGLAARLASAPVALKLATAAVGIGVVTTGASQVRGHRTVEPRAHSAGNAAAVARQPTRRAVTAAVVAPPLPAARTAGPSEQAGRRRARRHAETIHADRDGDDTEAATSREPAPAEPEADHSGPGPGTSTQPAQPLTATVELEVESPDGHDGSGSSGSSDGGGTDVRSDSGDQRPSN